MHGVKQPAEHAIVHPAAAPGNERRSGHFKPTFWHDNFIQSVVIDASEKHDKNMERVDKLIKEVSQMICKEESLRGKLELVDAIQQLGVAYHFKDEISCVMCESMDKASNNLSTMDGDLHEVVSLLFRLLRMHSFSVHEDLFKSYFDDEGNCKEKLLSDVKGMLSLYEASYLAREGEQMLETARHFTTKHLSIFLESSECNSSRLKEQVAYALDVPLNWRMERPHTRWFIDRYKTDEHIRPALWELAVLDFNLVQEQYRSELQQVSRWWEDLRLYEKLPFIRDRLVECYIFCVGFACEPEHASYRIADAKACILVTAIDDIYDLYGFLDELELFTDAIQQWDINVNGALPEYMKIACLALFETVECIGNEVLGKKGLNVIPHLRRTWKELCKAYLVEARWYHKGYAPTLEEYLENAWISISCSMHLLIACCMSDDVTAEDLEQLSSGYPDLFRYTSLNGRLYNDLRTSSAELKRGDNDKTVQCYMRSKSITEFVARQEIRELIRKNWALLNGAEAVLGNSALKKHVKNVALNMLRASECIYHHEDGVADPGKETKDKINLLLFEPIELF